MIKCDEYSILIVSAPAPTIESAFAVCYNLYIYSGMLNIDVAIAIHDTRPLQPAPEALERLRHRRLRAHDGGALGSRLGCKGALDIVKAGACVERCQAL